LRDGTRASPHGRAHPPGAARVAGRADGRATGALAAALALLLGAGAQAAPRELTGGDVLRAGAASDPLRLPAQVPLAGYGSFARRPWVPDLLGRHPAAFWFRPALGTREAVMGRALVIERGATRVLWVTVDLVAVDDGFAPDLAARLRARGLEFAGVIVSASHTHSGPGAFADSAVLGFIALDRFVPAVRAGILEGLAHTAIRADARRTPARLGASTVPAPPVARSRLDLPLDPEIVVLKLARPDGAPVALLWNYAIHPTMLGPRNLHLSGDVTGIASAAIERTVGAPALFVNGAAGDVSPHRHGEAAIGGVAAQLAETVVSAWRRLDTGEGGRLALARERVTLTEPFLRVRNCLGRWVPSGVILPLANVFPRAVELLAVDLADVAAVTVPGELQTALGLDIKAVGRRTARTTVVAGFSNGYVGYLLDRAGYDRTGYTACNSVYGPDGGERIAAAAARLLERVSAAGYASAASRRARADLRRAAVLR
jgi:neutral ceramidase